LKTKKNNNWWKASLLVRRAFVLAGLAFASAGCFALFTLDEYGPVDAPQNDAASNDDVILADAIVGDGGATGLQGRVVFVTSTTHNGVLKGVNGADTLCQATAADAGLPGAFKAWLSANNSAVKDRFKDFTTDGGETLPYITPDRKSVISASILELSTNGPRVPIAMTEKKTKLPIANESKNEGIDCPSTFPFPTPGNPSPNNMTFVWTTTQPNGEHNGNQNDCQRWENQGGQGHAGVVAVASDGGNGSGGGPRDTRNAWTSACQVPCDTPVHLYCFEQ